MNYLQTSQSKFILFSAVLIMNLYVLMIAEDKSAITTDQVLLDEKNQKPNAYLTGTRFSLFNEDGKLTTLYAEKAFFFGNNEDIAIIKPEFISNESTIAIKLTAEKGSFNPSSETLLLEGQVLAEQASEDRSWTLTSQQLSIDNKKGTLSSVDKVTIQNGEHVLTGIGLEASLTNKTLKLLSQVKGTYVSTN